MTMSWIDVTPPPSAWSSVDPGRLPGLVGPQGCVVGLGPAAQHRRQRVTRRPDVPAADARALRGLDGDDLPRVGEPDLVAAVHVEIEELGDARGAKEGVRGILGGDEVLVGGEAHVRDVDPAEQAVPVAVVGLAAVEVVQRRGALRALRHGRHLARRPQHLLVEVVDLPVLDLEVAPEPAAQPAGLRPMPGHGVVEQLREHDGLVRRQRPFAHLGVRRRRDVDATDGRLAVQPLRGRDGGQPVLRWPRAPRRTAPPSGARPSSARTWWARRRTSRRRRPSCPRACRPPSRASRR